jgi:hypothetical protein
VGHLRVGVGAPRDDQLRLGVGVAEEHVPDGNPSAPVCRVSELERRAHCAPDAKRTGSPPPDPTGKRNARPPRGERSYTGERLAVNASVR